MKVYDNFILSISQCSTNNTFCSQYIFEYICKRQDGIALGSKPIDLFAVAVSVSVVFIDAKD